MVLSPEEQSLLRAAQRWSLEHWNPHSDRWEQEGRFPREAFQKAAADGYVGIASPRASGGKGYSYPEAFLVYEGLAYGDPAVTFYLHIFNSLTAQLESWYDSSPSVRALLPDFIAGKKFLAFALSEREAGSDPSAGTACCTAEEDGYLLNGRKCWVSNSEEDDYYIVIVHDRSAGGMTMLLVDRNSEGLTVGNNPERIAGCAISCGELCFENCRVPKENLLSRNGLSMALKAIDVARLYGAATALGLTQRALDLSAGYLSRRMTFGKPVLSNQAIRFRLAEMQTELEAARWLAYHTAAAMDEGCAPPELPAMCKLKATSMAADTLRDCIRFFGAAGLDCHAEISRLMRFSHVLEITDGTNEIQKLVIGKAIAKAHS